MSNLIKYRVHEVAKDFGLPSKKVSDIMTKYLTPPKNHMQVLTDEELNVIFDEITQTHQIENIEIVFSKTYKEPPAAAPAPAATQPEAAPVPAADTPAASASSAAPAPAAAPPPAPAPEQPRKHEPRVRIIDTRGATVDLGRYDERIEQLVPERAQNMKRGKEKIKRAPDKKSGIPFSQKRRQEEQERMRRLQLEALKKQPIKVLIPDEISVSELAARMKKTGTEVVKQLMKLGVMASLPQTIDFETASLVAMEMGARVEREVVVTIEERLIDDSADEKEALVPRDPVVVVMGHVDHGKTSLLDYVRQASVASGEFGGITQHIGAYRVSLNGRQITFLDTPGHAAFTSMRMRGAQVTDIAILVVAADDGIMPQTVEAINHARAARVPIIVAINKMDRPDATPDKIMQQLTEHNLVAEEWGGDTIVCPVSAKTGTGIDRLLEMVLLTADMCDLRANPNRPARGSVIEARLDKGRGPVATMLVQNGTLRQGDILIAGTSVGRVRAMTDDKGRKIETAGPSVPVEIIGMGEVPDAGDQFHAVADERMARELVEQRKHQHKEETARPVGQKVSLEDLFAQIQEGQIKDLNIIVKADVQGSAEAVRTSLEKLSTDEVRVRVIHSAVGAINESDILLAATASAIIIGFNVRPEPSARDSAERAHVDVRLYRVIYEAIEEMEAAMKGLLAPKFKEVVLGRAEVRQVFRVTGVGTVAGCYVLEGKIVRLAKARLVRGGIVVHEGELASLKRFKDDAREVAVGYECGIGIERFNDIKEGDVIEAFVMEEIER
ncbi:MAG: translation initiation factor IF-2 [Oscillospiraceae bacterium]|jgi:translation initiation factor IF-2|nr:translation initiation factor IF-2 [Oscillospiraceae bacterium]